MPEVPAISRSVTDAQLRAAVDRLAPDISRQQRAHLLALIVLETARRPRNWNLGNLAASQSYQQDPSNLFWRPPWYEVNEDSSERDLRLHQMMLDGLEPSAFRAYPDLDAGLRALLKLLRSGRYDRLWHARGPRQWLEAQRETGYTPALDVNSTLPGFTSLVQHFGGSASRGVGESYNVGGLDISATPAAMALLGLLGYGATRWATRRDK